MDAAYAHPHTLLEYYLYVHPCDAATYLYLYVHRQHKLLYCHIAVGVAQQPGRMLLLYVDCLPHNYLPWLRLL